VLIERYRNIAQLTSILTPPIAGFRVALLQLFTERCRDANLARAERFIARAAGQGANIVVLPVRCVQNFVRKYNKELLHIITFIPTLHRMAYESTCNYKCKIFTLQQVQHYRY